MMKNLNIPSFRRWWSEDQSMQQLLSRYRWYRFFGVVLLVWFVYGHFIKVAPDPTKRPHFAKIAINMSPSDNQSWLNALQKAVFDSECKGILLYFDQAIGDGNAIGHTEHALSMVYQAKKTKPVVSYLYGYTLGSNYVLASAAQKVIAQETASIGGIGLRTARFEYQKLMDSVGIKVENHGFGKLKTQPDPKDPNYKAFKEHREGVTEQLQNWLLNVVAHNRKLDSTRIARIDNGQWYLGMRGIEYGLCDELGDVLDAEQSLALLGHYPYPIVDYVAREGQKQGAQAFVGALTSSKPWGASIKGWLRRQMFQALESALGPEMRGVL